MIMAKVASEEDWLVIFHNYNQLLPVENVR